LVAGGWEDVGALWAGAVGADAAALGVDDLVGTGPVALGLGGVGAPWDGAAGPGAVALGVDAAWAGVVGAGSAALGLDGVVGTAPVALGLGGVGAVWGGDMAWEGLLGAAVAAEGFAWACCAGAVVAAGVEAALVPGAQVSGFAVRLWTFHSRICRRSSRCASAELKAVASLTGGTCRSEPIFSAELALQETSKA
jgi:hypothetical protein